MKLKTWNDTKTNWRAAFEALVEQFRPKYLAEVQRFAESLRSKFESGTLRGYIDEDDDKLGSGTLPMDRLEGLCAKHFHVELDQPDAGLSVERDPVTALLILSVSPSACAAVDGRQRLEDRAQWVCARDVLAVAIARGWRKIEKDECTPGLPVILRWAQEARP